MGKENVLKCACCGQWVGQIKKNTELKQMKVRGRWNFLDSLSPGDTLELINLNDYDNARRAMYSKGIKHTSAKKRDGSGYQIQVK